MRIRVTKLANINRIQIYILEQHHIGISLAIIMAKIIQLCPVKLNIATIHHRFLKSENRVIKVGHASNCRVNITVAVAFIVSTSKHETLLGHIHVRTICTRDCLPYEQLIAILVTRSTRILP